jgi:hypothetical protein
MKKARAVIIFVPTSQGFQTHKEVLPKITRYQDVCRAASQPESRVEGPSLAAPRKYPLTVPREEEKLYESTSVLVKVYKMS